MSLPKRYTVTAALIYANGPIHVGHLAGCYLPSDIYVRYLRLKGEDVLFVSGTDEHGVPIMIRGFMEKISPQEVVDKYYAIIDKSFKDFGIEFDIYSRTSKPVHHEFSSAFFKTLYDKGYFHEKTTEQNYDEQANMFLVDRFIVGTCPHCANPKAYGDQCEKCGSDLSPDELINPHSALSGTAPVKKPTNNWFLPLDELQPKLEAYVNSHPEWKANVSGQCKSWLAQGLHPRAMTRDLNWGVNVPLPNAEGKVLYVWFDAPIGYITASKEWFEQPETRKKLTYAGAPKSKNWETYWKDKDSKLVHFIGKDNIVFHCLIFPAMLMAHEGYVLPDNVPANEFLNLEGDKISTSRNWAIWLHEYLEELPGKQDELRYVLTSISPEAKDGEFLWSDYFARVNNELVAIFSNFIHRIMVLTEKNYGGKVPHADTFTKEDLIVLEEAAKFPEKIGSCIDHYRFREGQQELMNLARLGNKYLSDNKPWELIKNGVQEERVRTVLYVSFQLAANLSTLCMPFLPFAAQKLRTMLNIAQLTWDQAKGTSNIAAGHQLGAAVMLFPKLEEKVIQLQTEKLARIRKENDERKAQEEAAIQQAKKDRAVVAASDLKPLAEICTFDDFAKMDIRVGTILEAEKMPKSDKLLKLKVDIGHSVRTILSGIAKHYSPEQVIGQQVIVLVNLAPRKMMGIESEGMILMAENADGELSFVSPVKEHMHNGGIVK